MDHPDFYYFTFDSTHCAMAASKAFGSEAAIIATPREITAACGMTLKIKCPSAASAQARLASLAAQGVHAKLYTRSQAVGYAQIPAAL